MLFKLKFVCVFGSFVMLGKLLSFSVFVCDSFLNKIFIYHFDYDSH